MGKSFKKMKKIVKIVAFRGKLGNSGGDEGRGRGAKFYTPGNPRYSENSFFIVF